MSERTPALTDAEQEELLMGKGSVALPYVLVSQVKSNRVVYFTDDPNYQPPMAGDWYYVSIHHGALPNGMTLRNCWGWRYNGGVFLDARETPRQSVAESLLENNRKALQRILCEKIDSVRQPFLASCLQGERLREAKLGEARAFIAPTTESGERAFPRLLEAVAVARHCSLIEAARLVIAKSEACERVLIESERFREQITQAIANAKDEKSLLALREFLLDKVYPELSEQFKYRIENTEPINLDAPLSRTHCLHEITRLKAQLRDAINRQREPLRSDYIGNDEIRRHKARLAQSLLENAGRRIEGLDYSALEAYATARALPVAEAARLLLNSQAEGRELLMASERLKDQILARIDAIRTLNDIQEVSALIKEIHA